MIFIARDLSVVRHISDRIPVMYLGRTMGTAPAARLVERPRHPYTQALIASVPIPDPVPERARPVLEGDLPSPLSLPSGWVFRTRCPKAKGPCAEEVPPAFAVEPGQRAACPYWQEPTPLFVEAAKAVA